VTTPRRTPARRHLQRGVALLEVGVAMLVLSVAFLGIAMLVTNTARAQRSGQAMVRAAALATDIAEQMRANRSAVEALATDRGFVLEDTYAALTASDALSVPTCGGRFVRPPSTDVALPPCATAKGFADFALAAWLAQVQTSLPAGAGSVVDLGNARRRIVVAWSEPSIDRANGAPAPITDPQCDNAPKFQIAAKSGVRCLVMEFTL
jgi:type IV pilus modification protein PilV